LELYTEFFTALKKHTAAKKKDTNVKFIKTELKTLHAFHSQPSLLESLEIRDTGSESFPSTSARQQSF